MPDIFLYAGEAAANDIRLRDPTASGGGAIIEADGNSSGTSTASGVGGAVISSVSQSPTSSGPAGMWVPSIWPSQIIKYAFPNGIPTGEAFGLPIVSPVLGTKSLYKGSFGKPGLSPIIYAAGIGESEKFGLSDMSLSVSVLSISDIELTEFRQCVFLSSLLALGDDELLCSVANILED